LEGAMEKYKINVNNLDCANCARKLEEELNKNDKFKNVVVNFGTSKLTYESNEKISIYQF
jgi:Cd2+/Zn2+-exporting ATPase